MNLETRKLEFIEQFLKIKSEDLLSRLEKLLIKDQESSHYENVLPMDLAEFNSRIDRSIEDSNNGHLVNSDDLKTIIDKWN